MIPEKSVFNFIDFKIQKSHFDFESELTTDLKIVINPSGEHLLKSKKFILKMRIGIVSSNDVLLCEVITKSVFEFENISEDQLNTFFCLNAPAIIFPYVRAYVSTLTIQSGYPAILLPTLNLISIGEDLRKNITPVNS